MKTAIERITGYLAILLFVLLPMQAKGAEWQDVNPSDYRYDMTLYAKVDFTTGPMDYSRFLLGAFVGDECRGIAEVLELDELSTPVLYLRVRSNNESGETVKFRYFDTSDNSEHEIEGVSEIFESNKRLGYPSDPYAIVVRRYLNVTFATEGEGTLDQVSGRFAEGTELEVNATAAYGWHFEKWEDGSVDNPRTLLVNDNMAVTAYFAKNEHTVKYYIDGELSATHLVLFGDAISPIDVPEKVGHTFSGWEGLPDDMVMGDEDLEVYGTYIVNKYKLTYMLGGALFSEAEVLYDSEIVPPAAPDKEGYTFDGWTGLPDNMKMPASDLTVYGSYTVNKYKLTYTIEGNVVSESEVEYGTALTAMEAPLKEGYTFDGWVGLPETMPAHDVTVTGSYTINSYKLVFKIGDVVVSESTVEYNSVITEPEAPEKEGHTFAGWEAHPTNMPASDLTINGSYTVNKYKLTYTIEGNVVSESEVEYGTALTAMEAPLKEGYTFDGWVGLPETMPAHDVTVTGSYTINTYTLVFKIGDLVVSESTVEYNSVITEPEAPEKEGHTFAGWEAHPTNMPASDLTVYGSYTVNKYKLTYTIEGTVVSESEVEYGTALTAMEAPLKEGYTFDGWIGLPETMPAHDVTVTGSYTINSYKLVFKIGDVVVSESTVEYNSVITEPEAPAKEGHTFAGWEAHPTNMPASDLTINGSYTVNKYKVTYMLEGIEYKVDEVEYGTQIPVLEAPLKEGYSFNGWEGFPEDMLMPARDLTVTGSYSICQYKLTWTAGGETVKEETLDFGAKITAPEDPVKEGHTFAGWEAYPETMPAKDLTINGSYTVNKYKIIYMLEGVEYKVDEIEYGTQISLLEAPLKEGYSFNGWEGFPEDMLMPARDLTVTGSYSICQYKLTWTAGGETIKEETLDFGAKITAPEDPVKEGHTFAGWEAYPETMPAKDLTINGSYTVNKYKITYMLEGVEYKVDEVEYGTQIPVLEAPLKEGYSFNGWEGFPEDMLMPARDLTVTGSYSINQYKLTWTAGGETVKEETLDFGAKITAPENPVKEGHTFAGWEAYPETMPAKDLTINGSYTVNKYKITYMLEGVEYKVDEVEYGTQISVLEAPLKEGYSFNGWEGFPEDMLMPARDLTVTGEYTINQYKLTFYIDDEVYSSVELDFGAAITVPEIKIAQEDREFDKWLDEIPETMPAYDLDIHGVTKQRSGISQILDMREGKVDVYDIEGVMILKQVEISEVEERLAPGIYIILGKKILVK